MSSYLVLYPLLVFIQDSIKTTEWQQLIPSDNLPKKFKSMHSNNNLDIVEYKGRFYVAYRTAPTHFASKKTMTYVMSSDDFENWRYECEFWVGADMREPRFVVYNDTLFFLLF